MHVYGRRIIRVPLILCIGVLEFHSFCRQSSSTRNFSSRWLLSVMSSFRSSPHIFTSQMISFCPLDSASRKKPSSFRLFIRIRIYFTPTTMTMIIESHEGVPVTSPKFSRRAPDSWAKLPLLICCQRFLDGWPARTNPTGFNSSDCVFSPSPHPRHFWQSSFPILPLLPSPCTFQLWFVVEYSV